jgi:hypothetical protein
VQLIERQPQRVPNGAAVQYESHRPKQPTLQRLVQQHAAGFAARAVAGTGPGLQRFIEDELDALLESSVLATDS